MTLRRYVMRSAAPVTLATAARLLFGVQFAIVALGQLDAGQSVRLFQLVFVQSIFITFVAGPGYPQALAAASDGRAPETLRRYARFVGGSTLLALLVVSAVPGPIIQTVAGADRMVIALLVVGGAGAALHGVFQAIVQPTRSAWYAFGPSIPVSLAASVALFLPEVSGRLVGLIGALVGYQIGSLAVLCLLNWPVLKSCQDAHCSPVGTLFVQMRDTFAVGLINCASIVITYLSREAWLGHASTSLAEIVFFLWRLSDLYLGIAVTLIAGSKTVRRLREGSGVLPAGAIIIVFALAGLGLTGATAAAPTVIVAALLAQLSVEFIRLPSAIATLVAVQRDQVLLYAATVLPGPAIAAAITVLWMIDDPFLAIYLFIALSSGLQLAAALVIEKVIRQPSHGLLRRS